jgi:hypothetical protein
MSFSFASLFTELPEQERLDLSYRIGLTLWNEVEALYQEFESLSRICEDQDSVF